ncbi:hypothetical protein NC651_012260 [Populus alba x Populus x berolinensis]|nr:hypothetical protein NC651_012260 [Populus alba x Populus x berolinensis]
MRLTSSVKIEALSNISSAYQPLSSKQSNESWMVSRVLPRLKPLGYHYFPTYPRFSGDGGVMDDRPKLCFGSFTLGFGPNPPVFLWFWSLFCPPVEIVFGKKAFGLCFSIGAGVRCFGDEDDGQHLIETVLFWG